MTVPLTTRSSISKVPKIKNVQYFCNILRENWVMKFIFCVVIKILILFFAGLIKLRIISVRCHCVKSVLIWSYSGPYYNVFELISSDQSECGKMRTRITPNTNTFLRCDVNQRSLQIPIFI